MTPSVVPLPPLRLSGDWSGTGDNRPRAFAAAGTEDVTVREYRLGDDLRRIHWRSTARADELMVRREEQPHQSRATLLLDARASAHRGSGPASSFEYAVSAAASIGAHLAAQQFAVRLISDEGLGPNARWHDRGISGPAEVQLLLDVAGRHPDQAAQRLRSAAREHHSSGLVVAVLGAVDADRHRRAVAAARRLDPGAGDPARRGGVVTRRPSDRRARDPRTRSGTGSRDAGLVGRRRSADRSAERRVDPARGLRTTPPRPRAHAWTARGGRESRQ